MAVLLPGPPVDGDLLGNVLDALAEQVREDVGSELSGQPKGFRVAGRRHPDGQLRLDRPRMNPHIHVSTNWAGERHCLATPETANRLDVSDHHVLRRGEVLRLEDKVVRLPAGCD